MSACLKKIVQFFAVFSIGVSVNPVDVLAKENEDFSAVIVTSAGGVEDGSFNQSAWEGLEEWGKETGRERGLDGYEFIQSNNEADYLTNLSAAESSGFDIIYGLGKNILPDLEKIAKQNPKQNFVTIDGQSELANVTSINFKEEEAAFLAGVSAALTSESNYIGFIGGEKSAVTKRYEEGFIAGVKEVNPDIKMVTEYVGAYDNPALGRQLASAMYSDGVDVIFHAAGGSGKGVFAEAKDFYESNPDKTLWVIGSDRDQSEEGSLDINGEIHQLTLTSVVKDIGSLIKDINLETEKNGFIKEDISIGLDNHFLDITRGQITEENWKIVQDYQDKIISGDFKIPNLDQETIEEA